MEVDKEKATEIMEKEAKDKDINLEDVIKNFNRISIKTNKEAVEEMKDEGILSEEYEPSTEGYCVEYNYEDDKGNVATQGKTEEEAYKMLFEAVALRRGLVGKEVEDINNIIKD